MSAATTPRAMAAGGTGTCRMCGRRRCATRYPQVLRLAEEAALSTLLGLADRPGEVQGLGLLDPGRIYVQGPKRYLA